MRLPLTLVLAILGAGCSAGADPAPRAELASATVTDGRARVAPFVPPSVSGCAGATAYDVCLAFDRATPLAVHVALPHATRPNTTALVRFVRASADAPTLLADHVEFKVGARTALDLYFQLYPGSYRIAVSVDTDGDGRPDGPGDAAGWSSSDPEAVVIDEADAAVVEVESSPIATAFTLALPR
jgi:hypothetical protein